MVKSKTKKVICKACNGDGQHTIRRPIDIHGKDYHIYTKPCATCEGSGILIKTSTYVPFVRKK